MANQTIRYSDASRTVRSNAFTRTGYRFNGWKSSSGSTYANGYDMTNWLKTNGTGQTYTWSAQWAANTYAVHFNGNGATGGAMSNQSFTWDASATRLTANAFVREGYNFAGWNTKADGTGTPYANQAAVRNLTSTHNGTYQLYAQWTKKTYAINYDLNGGSAGGATHGFASQTKEHGTAINLYGESPTREGYRFIGWGTSATATAAAYAPGAPYSTNQATTLYALWTSTIVNLQFDSNGGTGTMSDQQIDTQNYQTISKNQFEREFHTFMWWNTEADGSGARYVDQQTVKEIPVPNGTDLTLYAQWDLDPYAGTAYALLQDDGTLLLFRSGNTYPNDTITDVVDTAGQSYHGRVFTNIETMTPSSAAEVPWHAYRNDIKATRVASKQKIRPKSYAWWYANCTNLCKKNGTEALPKTTFSGFEATFATSTKNMFSECSSLPQADFHSFSGDTSLTDMSGMFSGCSSLKSVNLRGCNTGNVTSMESMFNGCSVLGDVDLLGLNTASVTSMASMFKDCSGLPAVDVAGFNTAAVTDFSNMFAGCSTIDAIDVSRFNTAQAQTMENMFAECSHLTYLDLGQFSSQAGTRQSGMFADTKMLAYVNLGSGFMFNEASLLEPPAYADRPQINFEDEDNPFDPSEYDWESLSKMVTSGKWKKVDGLVESRTAANLASTYSGATTGMAGGWCWEPFEGNDTIRPVGMVIFCGNGGHVNPSLISTEDYVSSAVDMPEATRNGYVLTGWNTSQDGTGTSYDEKGTYSILQPGEVTPLFAQWEPVPPYMLGGAVYRIYADSNCEKLITEVVTNPDGTCEVVELPIGTYWVKEYKAPRDFEVDPTPYPVTITDDGDSDLTVSEKPLKGNLQVRKQSANPETTAGDANYGFEGATYQVYSNPTCGEQDLVGTLVCEGNGFSNVLENLPLGKYYLCETAAPRGYVLDTNMHEVELTAENSTATLVFNALDDIIPHPATLNVGKRVTGKGAPTNEAFLFTVKLSPRVETVKAQKMTTGDSQQVSLASDADGNVRFTLCAGEVMSLLDIPNGTSYEVSEEERPFYATTWEGTSRTGVLTNEGNATYRVTAVNEYKSGELSVTKRYTGTPLEDNPAWAFKLILYDDQNVPVSGTFGGIAFDGANGYDFVLHKDETFSFDGIPAGLHYRVDELADDATTVMWEGQEGVILTDGAPTKATATNSPRERRLRLRKKMSGPTEWVTGNRLYSVRGAIYGLFFDEDCTSLQGEFTTVNQDGTSDILEHVLPGSYWVKELVAPEGLALDPVAHPVEVEPQDDPTAVQEIEMKDDLLLKTVDVLIQKTDASVNDNDVYGPSQGNATLAGAKFQVEFYEGYDIDGSELPENPTRTWIVQTDETGAASLSADYLVDGSSDLFVNEGQVYLPLGTMKIKEIQAPTGYLLDETEYVVPIVPTDTDDPDTSPVISLAEVDTTHVSETPVRGGLKVQKVSLATGEPLAGAVFGIYNQSEKPVKIGNAWYGPNALCGTITSDASGVASTATFVPSEDGTPEGGVSSSGESDDDDGDMNNDGAVLPYGAYSVVEMTPPTGYAPNTEWVKEFTIDGTTLMVDLTTDPCQNAEVTPEIGTTLTTDNNAPSSYVGDTGFQGNKQIALNGSSLSTTVYDTVACTNIQPGDYIIKGYLVNVSTGEKIAGSDGQTPQFTVTEASEEPLNKVVSLPLTLSNVTEETRVVAFEELYRVPFSDGTPPLAEHKDLNDYDQTILVYSVKIGTTLMINNKHDHIVTNESELSLSDVIAYENLIPGRKYILKGEIHAKGSANNDLGVIANATATITNVMDSAGTVEMPFTVSVADIPEETKGLVAFERLYHDANDDQQATDDELLATHTDLQDSDQTVVLHTPSIGTTLTTASGSQEKHITVTSENRSGTLCDVVAYQDLVAGEYKLEGVLHRRKDNASQGTVGSPASVTFTISDEGPFSGSKEVTLPFDLSGIADTDVDGLVAYEKLYIKVGDDWQQIGSHEDITDVEQTVTPLYPNIGTTLRAGDTKSIFVTENAKDVALTDTVAYKGLIAGHQYKLVGELHGKSATGGDLGTVVLSTGDTTVTKTFTAAEGGAGTETMDMPISTGIITDNLTGVVAFERLYAVGESGDQLIAEHCEIGDGDQTITVFRPSIGTTLTSSAAADGKHIVPTQGQDTITLVDTVSYENLVPGNEYVLHAVLHLRDSGNGNPIIPIGNGQSLEVTHPFTPTESNGTEDVTMTISLDDVKKGEIVAYETLYFGTEVIARHEKIDSPAQTVTLYQPGLGTQLVDGNGYHDLTYDATKTIKLFDTVAYTGLIPNASYTIKGTLHWVKDDGSDGGAIDGVTSSVDVKTDETGNGTAKMSFNVPMSKVNAKKLVAFERLFVSGDDDHLIAAHEDITDELQTVTFHSPDIQTTLVTQDAGHEKELQVGYDEEIVLNDIVKYRGLIPSREYVLKAVLRSKVDGNEIRGATGTVTFTASATGEGEVTVPITVNRSELPDGGAVAFERLFIMFETPGEGPSEELIATHEDIDDEDQTVTGHKIEIATTLTSQDGAKEIISNKGKTTLIDTVRYRNLIPGKEYTISGTLHQKAADGSDGGPVMASPASTTFTPTAPDGEVQIEMQCDLSSISVSRLVAFEELRQNEHVIAVHADINDEDQTVIIRNPRISTTLKSDDAKHEISIKERCKLRLIDTIAYEDLVPGVEYEVSGTLHVREGSMDAGAVTGATASAKFTPDSPNGTVDVSFDVDSGTATRTLVAFEELRLVVNGTPNETPIAEHKDISDAAQSFNIKYSEPSSQVIRQGLGSDLIQTGGMGKVLTAVAMASATLIIVGIMMAWRRHTTA